MPSRVVPTLAWSFLTKVRSRRLALARALGTPTVRWRRVISAALRCPLGRLTLIHFSMARLVCGPRTPSTVRRDDDAVDVRAVDRDATGALAAGENLVEFTLAEGGWVAWDALGLYERAR